jgi:hypothetical protein
MMLEDGDSDDGAGAKQGGFIKSKRRGKKQNVAAPGIA